VFRFCPHGLAGWTWVTFCSFVDLESFSFGLAGFVGQYTLYTERGSLIKDGYDVGVLEGLGEPNYVPR